MQIGTDSAGANGINSINTAYVSKGVSKNNLCFICNSAANFETQISMTGSYTVNVSEGIITNASNPSVMLVSYDYYDQGPCYLGIVTRSATISSSGQSATFYARFHIYREYTSGYTTDFGQFEGSIVGDPSGNLVSFSPTQYGYAI